MKHRFIGIDVLATANEGLPSENEFKRSAIAGVDFTPEEKKIN